MQKPVGSVALEIRENWSYPADLAHALAPITSSRRSSPLETPTKLASLYLVPLVYELGYASREGSEPVNQSRLRNLPNRGYSKYYGYSQLGFHVIQNLAGRVRNRER